MIKRIDHIGVVVADFGAHVDQLEALGLALRREGSDDDSHVRQYQFFVRRPEGDST